MDVVAPTPLPPGTVLSASNPGLFKLTMKAYAPRRPGEEHTLLEAGDTLLYDGVPGPHMEPIDERARALKLIAPQNANHAAFGGVDRISLTDPVEDDRQAERLGAVVARAVAEALIAAGITRQAQSAAAATPPPPPPGKR